MENIKGKLTLSLVSILFTLMLLEGVFRLLDMRGFHENRSRDWEQAVLPAEERLPGLTFQFRPHSEFRLNYESNPRGYFDAQNGLTYHLNNYGLRGPDIAPEKPEGVFRIIVLGDSFTFGEGVKWEDTFTYQLEQILRERVSPKIEVLNFGTSSWSTSDETTYLEQVGVQFQPDLVLNVYVLNDANYAGGLDMWENFRAKYEATGWLKHSYLFSFAYATIAQQMIGRAYSQEMVNSALQDQAAWDASFHFLQKGDGIAKGVDAAYAVIIFPFLYQLDENYPFAVLHQKISDFTQSVNIPTLDLLPAFSGQPYAALWAHPSDQHPNEIGHRLAAEAIANFLIEKELLRGE
jgi:lysophospholipase L1-like esterase